MKGHHYVSDTNKFIDLLNKLIINKRTHSRHNNCKTQNTYRVPSMTENVHAVTAEAALPAASDSSFTKMDASCPFLQPFVTPQQHHNDQ